MRRHKDVSFGHPVMTVAAAIASPGRAFNILWPHNGDKAKDSKKTSYKESWEKEEIS